LHGAFRKQVCQGFNVMTDKSQSATSENAQPDEAFVQPQLRKLHFFPASFPDETLFSRVSRYYLLTGGRRHDTTFHALFGRVNSLDFTELAPPSLPVLASLLPGDPMVQLGNLLVENTFVPFAVPVVRHSIEEYMGTEFGDSRACLLCLAEDEATVGVPYLHRSHQLPAVTACWKHGAKLVEACPDCEKPFRRPAKFLLAPITSCSCGWHATNGNTAPHASQAELEFAIHAHFVLEKRVRQTLLAVAVRFFQSQIERSFYKIGPLGQVNRRLLAGLVQQQLAEGRTATEVAMAAAAVMAVNRKVNWWTTTLSREFLKQRSILRQGFD
jgi:hypothetical protein